MATGYQNSENSNCHRIVLLSGATAANTVTVPTVTLSSTPTGAQLFDLWTFRNTVGGQLADKGHIVIRSTAGSGVMTLGACRVFVSDKASGVGGPYGVGADSTKGQLNNGAAFGETGSDVIYHREEITGLSTIDGIQVQLGAFGGTDPAFTVELLIPKYAQQVA